MCFHGEASSQGTEVLLSEGSSEGLSSIKVTAPSCDILIVEITREPTAAQWHARCLATSRTFFHGRVKSDDRRSTTDIQANNESGYEVPVPDMAPHEFCLQGL